MQITGKRHQPKRISFRPEDLQAIQKAGELISANIRYHYQISELARKVNLNERKLKYGFKAHFGTGPYGYLVRLRMNKCKDMLKAGKAVEEIARITGYKNSSGLSHAFKKLYGISPRQWMQEQE